MLNSLPNLIRNSLDKPWLVFRNPYSKPILAMLFVALTYTTSAQKPTPLFACGISGPTSVTYLSEATFTITGGCSVTGWSTTCGTISSQTSTSCMIYFNTPNCGSATITITGGAAAAHTVSISGSNVTPLSGGSISNTSQTINYNNAPGAIDASAASGGTCSGAYSYQWYSSTNGSSYSTISGATGQNYQPGALTTTTYFKRLTTCGSSTAYTSNVATVTVYAQLVAGSVSSSQSINYNTTPSTLTLSGVSGGSGSYTYQWLSSPNGSVWSTISGATGTSYSPSSLTSTTYYLVAVTSNGVTINSNYATITVYATLQAGSISPASQSITYNTAPSTMTLSGVSGGSGSYTYQWQSSATNTFSSITNVGSGTTTYTPTALTSTTYYRVAVTSNGVTVYSSIATVTVYPQLSGGVVNPHLQAIYYNTIPSTLTLAGVSGGNGTYSYQWISSSTASFTTFTDVGTNSTTYSPPTLTTSTYYRVIVTSNGVTANSSSAPVLVYAQLQSGTITPATQTINYNTSPTALTVSAASGSDGTYTYQWQSSPDNSTWSNISGQTSTGYSPPALTATTYYRVVTTDNSVSVNSPSAAVTVGPGPLTGGTISGPSGPIGYNTSPGALGSSQPASGGTCTGSYSYQWQYSLDGSTWNNIANATGASYSSPALTTSIYFRRQVSCSGTTATSNALYIQVTPQGQQSNCTIN